MSVSLVNGAFICKMSQNNYSPNNEKNPLMGNNWFATIQTNIYYAKAILVLKSQCGTFGNVLKSFIPIPAEIQNDVTQPFALQQRVNRSEGTMAGERICFCQTS